MVADNLVKVQMRGERIDELDERAGESIQPKLVIGAGTSPAGPAMAGPFSAEVEI